MAQNVLKLTLTLTYSGPRRGFKAEDTLVWRKLIGQVITQGFDPARKTMEGVLVHIPGAGQGVV
jgi:hypothetical protein